MQPNRDKELGCRRSSQAPKEFGNATDHGALFSELQCRKNGQTEYFKGGLFAYWQAARSVSTTSKAFLQMQ